MPLSRSILRPRFNPKMIAGLELWLDAADAASITLNSGNVSQWNDKSGNGRTLQQTTANNRPAWTAARVNGRYAAVFDGANDSLGVSFTFTQPITLFVVGKFNTTDVGQTMIDGATGNTMRIFVDSSANIGFYAGIQFNKSTTVTAWHVFEVVFDGLNSKVGIDAASSATPLGLGNAAPGGIVLGNFGLSGGAPSNCDIAHVVAYGRSLSSVEAASVRKWLAGLYGITLA